MQRKDGIINCPDEGVGVNQVAMVGKYGFSFGIIELRILGRNVDFSHSCNNVPVFESWYHELIIQEAKITFNSTFIFGNTLLGHISLLNVIVKGSTLSYCKSDNSSVS